MDGGANGGFAGEDVRLLAEGLHKADVTGIADSEVTDLPVCQVAGKVDSATGPIIMNSISMPTMEKGRLSMPPYSNETLVSK